MDLDYREKNEQFEENEQPEEEIVRAYLNQLEQDTPDLWNRIEAGIQTKTENSRSDTPHVLENRTGTKKHIPIWKWSVTIVGLAAVLFAAVLVVPYLSKLGINSNSESDVQGYVAEETQSSDVVETNDTAYVNGATVPYDIVEENSVDLDADDALDKAADDLESAEASYEGVDNLESVETSDVETEEETDTGNYGTHTDTTDVGVSCVIQVLSETEGIYHCRIISTDDKGNQLYGLSEDEEIDVIFTEADVQAPGENITVELYKKETENIYEIIKIIS